MQRLNDANPEALDALIGFLSEHVGADKDFVDIATSPVGTSDDRRDAFNFQAGRRSVIQELEIARKQQKQS